MSLNRIYALVALSLLQGCSAIPQRYQPYVSAAHKVYAIAADSAPVRPTRTRYTQLFSADGSRPFDPMRGVWTGSIACANQTRSLDLYVFGRSRLASSNSIAAIGPMTPRGRSVFVVNDTFGPGGEIQVTPRKELTHPTGIRPFGWSGSLQPDGSFVGNAQGGDCASLRLVRTVSPDDPRFVRAEHNHIGFSKDLLSTEYQVAQASTPWEQKSILDKASIVWGTCMFLSACPLPDFARSSRLSSSGGGGADDMAERARQGQRGGQPVEAAPNAPTLFPHHLGDGPGFGITH